MDGLVSSVVIDRHVTKVNQDELILSLCILQTLLIYWSDVFKGN